MMQRLSALEKDPYCYDSDDSCSDRDEQEENSPSKYAENRNGNFEILGSPSGAGDRPSKSTSQIEDDFEREANEQLSRDLNAVSSGWLSGKGSNFSGSKTDGDFIPRLNNPGQQETANSATSHNFVDDPDSDEEFYETEKKKFKDYNRSNDDLFYDPDSDNDNQKWINDKRRSYHGKTPLTKSDAILNCPACMTVLCYDCQRHDIYKTQYRAMFVTNCEIKDDEVLFVPSEGKTKKSGRGKPKLPARTKITSDLEGQHNPNDLFKPVICATCKTEIAVFDSEEVYHFFNVLSGHT